MDSTPYSSGVGSIMYGIVCTRPDLAYVISIVSRCLENTGIVEWQALKCGTPRIPSNVNHTCKSEYYNVYGMLHFVKYLNNRVNFFINKVNIN